MTLLTGRPVDAAPAMEPAHRFDTADGTTLAVRDIGPKYARTTVVFAHGWTQDQHTWRRVVDALPGAAGPDIRILSYDHRGHGGSAPARAGTACIEQLADDLAELLATRVPTGKLVLVGHSMGGMTLMALAERHADLVARRVAGVAFVGTSSGQLDRVTLGLPGLAGKVAVRIERRLNRYLAHRDAAPRLRPALLRPVVRWLVFGGKATAADVDSVARQALRAHPASVAEFRDSMAVHDRRLALAALRHIPTVVLAGDRDRLCPPAHAHVIADELPHGEFVQLPGAGHMLSYERVPEVTRHLASLIHAVRAGGAGGSRRQSRAKPRLRSD